MVLEAIQTTTIQDTVYNQLMKAIMEGKIATSKKITMDGLAKHLLESTGGFSLELGARIRKRFTNG